MELILHALCKKVVVGFFQRFSFRQNTSTACFCFLFPTSHVKCALFAYWKPFWKKTIELLVCLVSSVCFSNFFFSFLEQIFGNSFLFFYKKNLYFQAMWKSIRILKLIFLIDLSANCSFCTGGKRKTEPQNL